MIENFSGNVARLRKDREYSQEKLAEKIGLNKQTSSNIERGVRYPTFETLEKIVKVFKANPMALFGSEKQVQISDAESVMDRIDDYEDKIQSVTRFVKIFDHNYLEEINESFHKVQSIHDFFTEQPVIDVDGKIIRDENGEVEKQPASFDRIPFEKIDELVKKIEYIKQSKELI